MNSIFLTQDMHERAEVHAKNMIERLYDRFGYNDDTRYEKAYIGMLGEQAFAEYLTQIQIPFSFGEYDENMNSDTCDFWIYDKKFDIKIAKVSTSSIPNDNWTYGYPQEQRPADKYAVVIGLYYEQDNRIVFYGIISGQTIAALPVVKKNSYKNYSYLTPNHEFAYGDLYKNIEELLYINLVQKYEPEQYVLWKQKQR